MPADPLTLAPAQWESIIPNYEQVHRETLQRIGEWSDWYLANTEFVPSERVDSLLELGVDVGCDILGPNAG
jgi:hypothetical protein